MITSIGSQAMITIEFSDHKHNQRIWIAAQPFIFFGTTTGQRYCHRGSTKDTGEGPLQYLWAALAFAERGKPDILHKPLNLDINSSIPRNKQVTEIDADIFSNNYSMHKQTI